VWGVCGVCVDIRRDKTQYQSGPRYAAVRYGTIQYSVLLYPTLLYDSVC